MSFITGPIPEHIRKLMPVETRKALKVVTSAEAQAKLDTRREKELQENIASLLRQRNIWFDRQRMDKRGTGTVGKPDFLFAVAGHAVGFEVKTADGKLSEEQKFCHRAMTDNGWIVWTVRSEQEAVHRLDLLDILAKQRQAQLASLNQLEGSTNG